MPGIEVRSFDSPDETRPFEGNGQLDVVDVGGHEVARGTFEPGWRWSENVKPIAQTDSCEFAHFGYIVAGRMRVTMDGGDSAELTPGDVFAIAPGHDAEVVGDEACVMIDMGEESVDYARR
jgi:uncharacterized cupin superfamily protein